LLEHKKLLGYPRREKLYTRPEHLRMLFLVLLFTCKSEKVGEPTSGLEPLT
jgi:hypothetical protein